MTASRIASLLVGAGATSLLLLAPTTLAHADIYPVIASPRPLDLQPNERIVTAHASANVRAQPQKVLIQLAVLGPPNSVTPPGWPVVFRPGVEDCPSFMVSSPIPPVTNSDLADAQALVHRVGFAPSDISATIVHLPAKTCFGSALGVAATVGQLLLNVHPSDETHLSSAVSRIAATIHNIPNIRPAGVVLERSECDVEQTAVASARHQAEQYIQMLADIAGLTPSAPRLHDSVVAQSVSPNGLQTLCANAQPVLSPELGGLNPYFTYDASADYSIVADAQPGRLLATSTPRFNEVSSVPRYDQSLVAYQVRLPASVPFVSTQAVFRAVVAPDATLEIFSDPRFDQHSYELLRNFALVLEARGVPLSDVRLHRSPGPHLVVRVRTSTRRIIDETANSVKDKDLQHGFDVFVRDCKPYAQAVAQQALQIARERADTMAAAANLKSGAVIALNDAGQYEDAICGYGSDAPTERLDDAASAAHPHFGDRFAEFGSAMAVAFDLPHGAPSSGQDAITIPPAMAPTNINDAFTTTGSALPGSATIEAIPTNAYVSMKQGIDKQLVALDSALPAQSKRNVALLRARGKSVENILFRDRNCVIDDLRALAAATKAALNGTKPSSVHALIGQPPVYHPNDDICALTTQGGMYIGGSFSDYDRIRYTIEERVLAVRGL